MRISVTILLVLVAGVAIGWHFLPQPAWMKSLIEWYHGVTKKVGVDPTVVPPKLVPVNDDTTSGHGWRREHRDLRDPVVDPRNNPPDPPATVVVVEPVAVKPVDPPSNVTA